ncbi:MAG TPA: hypothetical protein VF422_03245 [Dokdonella sp.]
MSASRHFLLVLALSACAPATAANPLRAVGETFSQWKERLFGEGRERPHVVDAPATGTVMLPPGQPLRLTIGDSAPEREFPGGRSRYRVIELPAEQEQAAVRVQVIAVDNPAGRGNVVFKPWLYVLGDDDEIVSRVEVKPMHVDIRPFRPTRLLGCETLKNVRRFAVATTPEAVGKSYESKSRNAVKAPTRGGFYYATDAVKLKLPYAATGELVIDVPADGKAEGC